MEKLLVKLLVHGVMITAILVGLSNATFASAVIALWVSALLLIWWVIF